MSRYCTTGVFESHIALPAAVELLKPLTLFPPMWALACCVVLAGPMVCATSQAVNDRFDRHVDAINEPQRPIPSARLPGRT